MKTAALRIALALPLAFGMIAAAQSNHGNIRGTVMDPSGALVPDAQITVTGSNGVSRTCESGPAGAFEMQDLASGNYSVSINAAGFTQALNSIQVKDGQTAEKDVTLRISVDQEIDVTADDTK